MHVFDKIYRRRKQFEKYTPIPFSMMLLVVYSYVRSVDESLFYVPFILLFITIIINNVFVWKIYGLGTKKTSFKPKINYFHVGFFTISGIGIIEMTDYLIKQ